MKKIQYSYLPSDSTSIGGTEKNKPAKNKSAAKESATPPSEETIARLNAIAREYPFCAYMKQRGSNTML
jgi:hypothetical protein